MWNTRLKSLLLGWVLMATAGASALELDLPAIFADQMVLQRGQSVPVWGTADAGARVVVQFAGQEKRAVAGVDGAWRMDLDAMDASAESRVMTIVASLDSDTVRREIADVLVGEVWFAGGQSNMYRPFRMLVGPARDPRYEPIAVYLREEAARANDPLFRQYRVGQIFSPHAGEGTGRGSWSKAVAGPVNEFCGTAYFFGRELRRELQVPVAMISCNLGGTRIEPWIAPQAFGRTETFRMEYESDLAAHQRQLEEWDADWEREKYTRALEAWKKAKADGKPAGREPRKPTHPSRDKQVYGTLYNGMVHPVIPYAMKGAIWYQGESNTRNYPEEYDQRLAALIDGWREAWGQETFHFFWCQLANYREPNEDPVGDEDTWALLQDRQRLALRLQDSGIAVLNDIGEAGDVHPKNKVDAGRRLSLWALHQAYGRDLVFSGPLFREARLKGNKVMVTFDHTGSGLMVGHKHLLDPTVEVDEPLRRFQICGEDMKWKWADAEIVGRDSVAVWHDDIERPLEIRYAWSSNPDGANLYNREGLPASLFKTGVLQTVQYDGSWEALQTMPVPGWFDDGKIGIFIHWGPYSVIGYRRGGKGYAEHVPKLIYADPEHHYPYLKKRWGAHPPEFGYKDILPEFTAAKWDPDEWADLFKEVGARYVVMTAEHHDGWANWDSDLTPWNAVARGPKRDLVGDLGKALRKRGLKYAPSYHRERHTGFFANETYVVHSEPRPDIAEEIKRVPESESLYGPFSYSRAFVDDYVARWKEIQDRYHPDMMWLDDFPIYTRDGNRVRAGTMKPEIKYFDDQVRGMITDFMNVGAARGQAVYVNNKGGNPNWPEGVGCREKDNLKLKVVGPKWQSCTTFGTSFGYLADEEDPGYPHHKKSVEQVIHEMVEIISRNGNFLINIGPRADGTIPPWQVERLRAMGEWLEINGDAIYGTRYWKENAQENEHLSFTVKGKTLYAIKRARPVAPFIVEATAGWKPHQVESVRLIGSGEPVSWQMTSKGLEIAPPKDLGTSSHAWSFEIETADEQHVR